MFCHDLASSLDIGNVLPGSVDLVLMIFVLSALPFSSMQLAIEKISKVDFLS